MDYGRKLYHKDIYLPEKFEPASLRIINFTFSKHLKKRLENPPDEKHKISKAKLINAISDIKKGKYILIEVEANDDSVMKAVFRTEYNSDKDITIVFRWGIVVIAWLNSKSDTHTTLDRYKYTEKELI